MWCGGGESRPISIRLSVQPNNVPIRRCTADNHVMIIFVLYRQCDVDGTQLGTVDYATGMVYNDQFSELADWTFESLNLRGILYSCSICAVAGN
jgi:hypothetical protein